MAWRLTCAITNHSPPFIYSVHEGSRWMADNATIVELLEDLAEFHHVNCGCNIKVGQSVWSTSLDINRVFRLDTVEAGSWEAKLPLHTLLDSVPCPPSPEWERGVQLLVSGETSVEKDYLALWRDHTFVAHMHRNARVFTQYQHPKPGRRPPPPRLPAPDLTRYEEMCGMPGLIFVDKTEQLSALLSHLARAGICVLRRPKGFGKTTLLSMLDAFFDINSPTAYFPFVFSGQDMSKFPFNCHHRLLVFTLDFAELNLNVDFSGAHAECRSLMNRAAERFYARYKELFAEFGPELAGTFVPSFIGVMGFVGTHGLKLFVTVDNYTTPIIQCPWFYEDAISMNILDFLRDLRSHRRIYYGLIVGETLPAHLAHTGLMSRFADVSEDAAFMDTIGFTPDEVAALGAVAGVDILKEMPPVSSQPPGTKFVYAAAHVVSAARALVETGSCPPWGEYPYDTMFLWPEGTAGPLPQGTAFLQISTHSPLPDDSGSDTSEASDWSSEDEPRLEH